MAITKKMTQALKNVKNLKENQGETIKTLKKIDENIYAIDYKCDYDLDSLLESGVSNTAELLAYAESKVLFGSKKFWLTDHEMACSAFNARNENGEHILGRNFDYKAAPVLACWTHPENGYNSVSFVDCNFMLYGPKRNPTAKQKRLQTLIAPFCPVDGINEKGLTIIVLQIKGECTCQETGRKKITPTVMIRTVLDKCATVEEALEYYYKYDMHDALGVSYHYIIGDAQGNSVLIEYINNELRVIRPTEREGWSCNSQYLTNFFVSDDGNNTHGDGWDRYRKIGLTLEQGKGTLTEAQAMNLLSKINLHYYHKLGWEVITLWSAVYNCEKASVKLCAGMDYSRAYSLNVASPCEFSVWDK